MLSQASNNKINRIQYIFIRLVKKKWEKIYPPIQSNPIQSKYATEPNSIGKSIEEKKIVEIIYPFVLP